MSTQFDRADAVITALGDEATLAETEYALRDFPDRVVRVALAKRAAAGGGGLEVLADPGVAWEPDHVYAEGDLFANTIEGELRVFKITAAGTSGGGAFLDYGIPDLVPGVDNTWGTGSESFIYIGIVGQISWEYAPFLGGGLAVGPVQDTGHPLVYTTTGAPEDSEEMFRLNATVDDAPVAVFEAQTDGDADWLLDTNAGAGFRFNNAVDGVIESNAGKTQMTTDGFKVYTPTEEFSVAYDPFTIKMVGLPTADPGAGHAGELWVDVAAGRVLKVSAG